MVEQDFVIATKDERQQYITCPEHDIPLTELVPGSLSHIVKLAVRGELFIEGFSLPCFYTPWYKLPGGIHIHSATLRTPSRNDSRTTELRHPNVSVKYNGGCTQRPT